MLLGVLWTSAAVSGTIATARQQVPVKNKRRGSLEWAEDGAQLAQSLPHGHRAPRVSPKLGGATGCNFSTWEVEGGASEVQSHPW